MNQLGNFRTFFWVVFGIFFFTWAGVVVLPWLKLGHLPPIQDEGGTDITPYDSSGLAHQGEAVYAANGCVYCHTQVVRDGNSGADLVRGWGTAKDSEKKEVTRRSYPRDYIWQGQTFLGNSREGADLSNVGSRFSDPDQLYAWLYHPETFATHSSMPAYKFLFATRRISGQASPDALQVPDALRPPAGYEIIPTSDAKALVAYLLSLNKGYHLKPDEAGRRYVPPAPGKN